MSVKDPRTSTQSKKHRVIFSAHQPYAIRAAELICERDGWRPVYWMCKSEQAPYLEKRFGRDLIVHDYMDAVHGRRAPTLSKLNIYPFDPDQLTSVEEYTALNMLSRNDSYSQTMGYEERFDFLLNTIGYWISVIRLTEATCVIFEEIPHQAIDYILYLSAKYCGILTIIPMRGLPKAGFFASRRIGDLQNALLTDGNNAGTGVRSGTGAVSFVNSMNVSYDAHIEKILWNQTNSVRNILQNDSLFSQFFLILKFLIPNSHPKIYLRNFFNFKNDQKVSGKTFQDSNMNYPEFLFYKLKNLIKKNAMRRLYQRMSSPGPSLHNPFVYCCLQYQPEVSTSPMAGRYVNQWLMVDHLAASLPDGWRLYVKEHPSQFATEFARYGESYRSRAFYERLTSNEKVHLVPLDVDSFTLIDSCRAVASPGGTACFEAVARGKMAINFGGGFFAGCPGIIQVKTLGQVKIAVEHIASGATPSKADVVNYAAILDHNTYPGALGPPKVLKHVGVSIEENAALHRLCWLNVASQPH